ncbi:hypothetical protein [Streptomyces sp. NRRL F-5123]|uniref:hypothetical protein n=1 Tax=Streptomyces sp. NRRL F-5123 TaxID=1463856 RepID=UPI0004E1AAE1|nr:hypothetical protein [Streptomyces sp. NRRL F-5123]
MPDDDAAPAPPAAPADAADPVGEAVRSLQLRRIRLTAVALGGVVAALTLVPVLLVARPTDPAPVMFTAGLAAGVGLALLPHLCVARGAPRRHGPDRRYLTARTWAGPRTLDLHDLRGVRTWKEVGRNGTAETYLVLTDTAGIRLSLSDSDLRNVRLVRRYALERPAREERADAVHMSRLALADLGVRPLPRVVSGLRSLLSVERTALMLLGPMTVAGVLLSR